LHADLDYRISQPGDSKAMIVCSCHVFDDEQLRSTIAKAPQRMRMSQIYASLGLSAQCGRCAHTIKRIKEQMSDYAITSAGSNANLQARAR